MMMAQADTWGFVRSPRATRVGTTSRACYTGFINSGPGVSVGWHGVAMLAGSWTRARARLPGLQRGARGCCWSFYIRTGWRLRNLKARRNESNTGEGLD